uniref:Uncharacterized protein n=1 Tax=viral metagenome TaxID=1070528 RepID=A0A6C0JVL0_9ZZZZ
MNPSRKKILIGGGIAIVVIILIVVILYFTGFLKSEQTVATPSSVTSAAATPIANVPVPSTPIISPTAAPITTAQVASSGPIVRTTKLSSADKAALLNVDVAHVASCLNKRLTGSSLAACITANDPNNYCIEQGIFAAPNCGGCGVNVARCLALQPLYQTLIADGVFPKLY